jgi:cell wall assembly regulator SMI1
MSLDLTNSSKKLSKEDIEEFKNKVNINLPKEFYSFYEQHNGGIPEKNSFYIENEDSYVEISFFMPIKNKIEKLGNVSIENSYHLLIDRNVLLPNYLPFAVDWGGNYFCINHEDDSIVLVFADMGVFAKKNVRLLTYGFNVFLNHLHEKEEEDV